MGLRRARQLRNNIQDNSAGKQRRSRLPPRLSNRGCAGGGAGAGAEEERWKKRVRANVKLLSPQSESDRCGLLLNVYPSHDELGGAVLVSGGAVQAPEGAFVVAPSCLGASRGAVLVSWWEAVLVSGATCQAPEGADVVTPSCSGVGQCWCLEQAFRFSSASLSCPR